MARPKDRLHKAIVIGATPAGVVAANKLGELGFPVTLVDTDPDLHKKLGREEWRLPSGTPLNFAHRSGLIRLFRNPSIQCVLPAQVLSLKHTPQGFRVRLRQQATFVDPERCVLCGRCLQVCPVTCPTGQKPIDLANRMTLPGGAVMDKRETPPCQSACPLHVNAQGYVALAGAGRFQEALDLVRRDNVLPAVCGRVCTHPCELQCRRGEVDEPIAIRDIKRFLTDEDAFRAPVSSRQVPHGTGKRIAVVGSGPAGLAAAADLARLGHGVTVLEKEDRVGGFLRYALGPHRLPRAVLDQDVAFIQSLGVQFKVGAPVDISKDLPNLARDFDAVLLTIGTWADRRLGVPGEDLTGVDGCLAVLNRLYREGVGTPDGQLAMASSWQDQEVAVIGDGNAAFDLARVLARLGARVTLVSWFGLDEIPADPHEVAGAREEGVLIVDRTRVVAFEGENGQLRSLVCRATRPGKPDAAGICWPVLVPESKPIQRTFDRAVVAIGQVGTLGQRGLSGEGSLQVHGPGLLKVDDGFHTNLPGVYGTGDAVTGPTSVVQTMASAREAARALHRDLTGARAETFSSMTRRPQEKAFDPIPSHLLSRPRPPMPEQPPSARQENFQEVALGLNRPQVLSEAERCLQCGVCSECLLCMEACEAVKAIRHHDVAEEFVEQAGVVIIADPSMVPSVKGEDVIRAYGPVSAKSNVHGMLARGFSAAARAAILMGGSAHMLKGRGISFLPPDPGLSPDIRMGVFVCRCNDSFGWLPDMDRFVKGLTHREGVEHAEILPAACVPEGTSHILRSIREKGLTRIVLASCVCCPLDFVCSACTDQRSRLKHGLFHGTGISRAMIETCNLRGEALRLLPALSEAALGRFVGMISRSINRAQRLKPLSSPMRTYNFATAVIGESEAARTSAMALAAMGLEVFLFGSLERPLTEVLEDPNIHCFVGSQTRSLSGTLGNFHVQVETDGYSQDIQVGAVILGDRASQVIPYIPHPGLQGRSLRLSLQERGKPGTPFLYPGATPIAGLFLASPAGTNISRKREGAAAAALAAAVMPRGPRQSKGFTVTVDGDRCRGCGRCEETCPYQAISLQPNLVGGWFAVVDEALCKGCGNCISVCPSSASDSPYRNQAYLEQILSEVLMERREG